MDQTRRALLRRTALLAGTAGLAGCSAFSDDETTETVVDGSSAGTATETATDNGGSGGQIGQWLAPPSVVDRDHYQFVTLRPTAMGEYSDALPEGRTANFDTEVGLAGFDTVGSLRSVHQTGIGLTVYDGPFDRSLLVGQLTGAGFSSDGGYRGFDVYSADRDRVVAVGERQVAQVDLRRLEVSATAGTVTQAAIDAYSGGQRYGDTDADVGALLSALGTGHVLSCRPDSTVLDAEGALGEAGRWRIGRETTNVAVATVFESADATATGAVESWAAESGPFGDVTPSVSAEGRVVLAEADVPTAALGPFEIGGSDDGTPQIALNFAHDGDAGTVTITHHGGDAVPADRLEIRGDGFADRAEADQTSAGPWAGTTSGDGDTVVAGDSVVVGVTPSYKLLVLYTQESGGGVTLGSDQGPGA